MPFFWQRSDRAVRNADVDVAAEEKLIPEPIGTKRLTDEEAFIIHNLVELHLIDPCEEESFLRRKKNQAGISLDERKERKGPAAEGCPVVRLVVRKPAVSVGSLLLHVLTVLCAVMGRRFLNQARDVFEANQLGAGDKAFAHILYLRFWRNGAADVLPLVSNPIIVDDGAALTCQLAHSSNGMACGTITRPDMPTQRRADAQQRLRNHHDCAAHILPDCPDRYGWI